MRDATNFPIICVQLEFQCLMAAGATAALHVSRPRQALLGPRRFAFVDDSGVPIVGLGATVGTVETRVPRAGLPRPTTLFKEISLRTRLSKPGEAPHAR